MTLSVDLMVTLLSKALQLHKYCSADSDASLHEILLSSVHVSVLVDIQTDLVHLFSVCVCVSVTLTFANLCYLLSL